MVLSNIRSMGNLTPLSRIDIKGKKTTLGSLSFSIFPSGKNLTLTSWGMLNLVLKATRATLVLKRYAKHIFGGD